MTDRLEMTHDEWMVRMAENTRAIGEATPDDLPLVLAEATALREARIVPSYAEKVQQARDQLWNSVRPVRKLDEVWNPVTPPRLARMTGRAR